MKEMRINMDEADMESFDKFIEKHWPNVYKKSTYTLEGEKEVVATAKRGRKPKNQV